MKAWPVERRPLPQLMEEPLMKKLVEELAVHVGPPRFRLLGEPPFTPVAEITPLLFRFQLCRKRTVLGEVSIDHFWMDTGSLYGQRKRRAVNLKPVVEYWWAVCKEHLTIVHEPVQESYILANLLPYARSHGSRRVFADAMPRYGKHGREPLRKEIEELEGLLAASRTEQIDIVRFRDVTASLLGPPDYPDEVRQRHQRLSDQLLGEGREALQRDGEKGLQVAIDLWQQWMKSIGRRRGNAAEKMILDILSYECRAALHRCYSQVWCDLLPHLQRKYHLSEESVRFHCLWHLDQCQESNQPEVGYFHLFHGHVFGLHPASGVFIQTKTGSELLGQWLEAPEDPATRGRLLHGLMIAMYRYADRKEEAADLRKRRVHCRYYADMAALEKKLAGPDLEERRPWIRETEDS